jgi:hypothetical protein
MEIKIVKEPIKKADLASIANADFGDIVKAVVDVDQEIMAIGGELHADEEVILTEQYGSKRPDTWGINLIPKLTSEDWIVFDSMINLKPNLNNRSRGVENPEIREKIKNIVKKLVIE